MAILIFQQSNYHFSSLLNQQKAENFYTKSPASGGEKFIVIVDDERDIVDSLQRALQVNGFSNVVGFTDPEKALDFFAANHEHVCIVATDVRMPSMSGIDLARQIRSIDPRMKVLFTTAYEMYNDEKLNNAMRDLCITGCIKKPASMQQFYHLVESYYRSSL